MSSSYTYALAMRGMVLAMSTKKRKKVLLTSSYTNALAMIGLVLAMSTKKRKRVLPTCFDNCLQIP